MAKRTKIASLPGFAVYLDSEAKENERYQVYALWHDNHPEYGYLRKRKTLVGKYRNLSGAMEYMTNVTRRTEGRGAKWYHACATYNGEVTTYNLFTTSPAHNLQEALDQFSIWEANFDIKKAWIDVYENGEKVDTLEVKRTWRVKENGIEHH